MSAVLRDSALPPAEPRVRPMLVTSLEAVMSIETAAYRFPWSRGNFIDSLAAGYLAELLVAPDGALLGYYVAMAGVDEMHLLNITVAPAQQGRGHARTLLDALVGHCRQRAARQLWLEVRMGNDRARAIYRRYGFMPVGVRKGYYPAPFGRREDAEVMSLQVPPGAEASDALD